jgi:uncharacterized RDD family membrane protein YckC
MDRTDPYAPPEHGLHRSEPESDPAWKPLGFWPRVMASIIDNIVLSVVLIPLAFPVMAVLRDSEQAELIWNLIASLVSAAAIIALWTTVGSTPGKMVLKAKVLDARTLKPPGLGKSIGRYFGYILSALPLGLGFLWVAWEPRKRAWHDMLAGTLVLRAVRPPVPDEGAAG